MGEAAEVLDEPAVQEVKLRVGAIPVYAKIKARNLYLHQGLPYAQIAKETGIKIRTLEQIAHKEGWTGIRKRTKEKLIKASDARAESVQTEVLESLASESEQHAIRALQKTGEALERTDRDAARDSQSYSAAAKNLVGIAKAIREPSASLDGAQTLNLNLFFVPAVPKTDEPKSAQPIDVKAVQSGSAE